MTDKRHTRVRRHGRPAVLGLLALFAAGILLQWSWNVFAAELLQAPPMQFRHAVAAEVLLALVFSLAGMAAGAGRIRAAGKGPVACG